MGARAGVEHRDGPKTIFADGVRWLRENAVLLPGVTTAARLVSRVRDEALDELYATLAALPGPHLAARLEGLVVVPDGARYSELKLWRRMPSKPTGRGLERSLNRYGPGPARDGGPRAGAAPAGRAPEAGHAGRDGGLPGGPGGR